MAITQTNQKYYTYISKNFNIVNEKDLSFPFSDMGFLYGYGLFETMRVTDGKVKLMTQHYKRLFRSSISLDIDIPFSEYEFCAGVTALIQKNKVSSAVFNVYLTAGDRSGLLTKEEKPSPVLLMVLRPFESDKLKNTVRLDFKKESFQRTPLDGLKTMAWMKNWLELRFSNEDSDDVLLYNGQSHILETPLANVFFVKNNQLITPCSSCVLQGVTREFLIENQQSIPYDIIQRDIHKDELAQMDEIFLTNSLKGIVKVTYLKSFPQLKSKSVTENIEQIYNTLYKQ